ncbi:MAG: GNAT family N-acetyltransferase [bacterium]|nr:GNAT family N-acetyltransferase [bacterium]
MAKINLKIKGKPVSLRSLLETDDLSIYQHAKDPAVIKYTSLPRPYKLSNAREFIQNTKLNLQTKKAFELGIHFNNKNQIIGMISLMEVDPQNKNAEIGFWLGRQYWRKGIMTEAVKLILGFGFNQLQLVRIYANVMHPNTASARLLEKTGFDCEGRLRQAVYHNGQWLDYLVYSILKTGFKPLVS